MLLAPEKSGKSRLSYELSTKYRESFRLIADSIFSLIGVVDVPIGGYAYPFSWHSFYYRGDDRISFSEIQYHKSFVQLEIIFILEASEGMDIKDIIIERVEPRTALQDLSSRDIYFAKTVTDKTMELLLQLPTFKIKIPSNCSSREMKAIADYIYRFYNERIKVEISEWKKIREDI